ncbi:MAG: FMN-binding protein [Clostridia bacterium]|nr:FMN-binding protein [Clostridia bacterium]
MRNVKSIAVAALTLTLICAVVVAALAGTNLLTKGPIAENERLATENACKAVMPTAATFETVDGTFADGVVAVYEGKDADGASTGYVVKTSTRGKSKDLVLMTAVAADGTVYGIEVVSESETAGYMNKVKKGGLFDRLVGVSEECGAVDGVAGATKTSNGVKDGVALAVDAVKEVVANG